MIGRISQIWIDAIKNLLHVQICVFVSDPTFSEILPSLLSPGKMKCAQSFDAFIFFLEQLPYRIHLLFDL